MFKSNFFILLIILVLIGHVIAFIFYAYRVLAREEPEITTVDNDDKNGSFNNID